ncbi:acyl-CoA dehydrogenase [Brevibacillus sp. SKDU10]|uniref:acyl-CoA dehydrogenase family protein n=1 Tax=Brevibacillus sp. SKDU10 TaxID=1247872 RepID=UPI0007C8BFDD|nr:acyl-CoA dehydrogenase family protein [Brevibacillus sp. SKDU10]OAJ75319.1 acyl-CoA dehydrogenase [Brevibacillus sp. SKDU10]
MNTSVEQADILAEVEHFAQEEIRPFAKEYELNEELPSELRKKMGEKGYLTPSIPTEYGGLGLDPIQLGLFIEQIGKSCNSVRELITVHNSLVGETIVRWGTKEQKEKWLPLMTQGKKIAAFALSEPNVGTDARSVETCYRKEGNQYIISGIKKWISFADIADVFLVIASHEEEGQVTAFLVERESKGIRTTRMTGLLASKASHIAEVEFRDVVVPAENVLGPIGGGFSYIASYGLDHGRYNIAWGGVAIAQASLEAMISYSRRRTQFGKKLCEFDLMQGIIADATTKIHAARALCLHAGKMRMNKEPDSIMETAMAKYFSSKMVMEVTTDVVQAHGGNGFSNQYPVERYFREAKLLEIIEGTSQVMQLMIAQHSISKNYEKRSNKKDTESRDA